MKRILWHILTSGLHLLLRGLSWGENAHESEAPSYYVFGRPFYTSNTVGFESAQIIIYYGSLSAVGGSICDAMAQHSGKKIEEDNCQILDRAQTCFIFFPSDLFHFYAHLHVIAIFLSAAQWQVLLSICWSMTKSFRRSFCDVTRFKNLRRSSDQMAMFSTILSSFVRSIFFFIIFFAIARWEHASYDDAVDFDKIARQENVFNEALSSLFEKQLKLKITYLNIQAFSPHFPSGL